MVKAKAKPAEIAKELGFCVKTIYNELERGMCVQMTSEYEFIEVYCPEVAERKYQDHLRAKGPDLKIGHDHAFANYVEDQIINKNFSPGAVLANIREEGLEFDTKICETTLYNYIYRGDVFLELTEQHLLYKGEHHTEKREKRERSRQAPGETIEHRPEEIKARETFGHWEMDSIMGVQGSKAALVTLLELVLEYN